MRTCPTAKGGRPCVACRIEERLATYPKYYGATPHPKYHVHDFIDVITDLAAEEHEQVHSAGCHYYIDGHCFGCDATNQSEEHERGAKTHAPGCDHNPYPDGRGRCTCGLDIKEHERAAAAGPGEVRWVPRPAPDLGRWARECAETYCSREAAGMTLGESIHATLTRLWREHEEGR